MAVFGGPVVGFNNFAELAAALLPALQVAVQDTATDVASHIQETITANGQVQTGHMLDSVYVNGPLGSTYSGGGKDTAEESYSGSGVGAVVGVSAFYSIFQELGTRFMPPHPFVDPGTRASAENFMSHLAQVEDAMRAVAP